jgi:hypothetical protein
MSIRDNMMTNYCEPLLVERVSTGEYQIEIAIPDTILKMQIGPSVFESAVCKFNYDVTQQELFLCPPNSDQKIARICKIQKENDDLFLVIDPILIGRINFLDCAKYTARLQGFVFMNIETGAVEELVIEGFHLMG